jgi:hypothetical protein
MAGKKLTRTGGPGLGVPAGGNLRPQFEEFLRALDPRGQADVQLALASGSDGRFQNFLVDACTTTISYAEIAEKHGITLAEFQAWWTKENTHRALARAAEYSPRRVETLNQDAEPTMGVCERCDGLGHVGAPEGLERENIPGYRVLRFETRRQKDQEGEWQEVEVPVWIRDCPAGCNRGKVRKPGSEDAAAMILEMAGLLNKKGQGLSITMNLGGQSLPSAISRMERAVTVDVDAE